MKINKEYFDNAIEPEWAFNAGEKAFELIKINETISAYASTSSAYELWFENETLETLGRIDESDVRMSRNRYFNATFYYGWDGKKKTKKDYYKSLCTRASYIVAKNMLLDAYNKSVKE